MSTLDCLLDGIGFSVCFAACQIAYVKMSVAERHDGGDPEKFSRKRPASLTSSDSEEESGQTESGDQKKEPRMDSSERNDQEETSVSDEEEKAEEETPAVVEQGTPTRDSLLIKPMTQKERETLSKRLDPIEMEVLMKQFNTDDEIVRIAHKDNKLIKCSVHISTAMASVMFQVPEYESVKFMKRRLVKYGLGTGVFLSSIDRIYLEVQSDDNTGIETMILPETDVDMLECFLYNLGFRSGNEYKIRMAFKSNQGDQVAEQTLIEEAKSRDLPHAITNLPLNDDPQIKAYQQTLQNSLHDNVEYQVLSSMKSKVNAKPSKATERSRKPKLSARKWTQERLNTFIEYVTTTDPKQNLYDKGRKLMQEYKDLFPASESRKEGFLPGDFRDKWTNIVGGKGGKICGFFNRKTAKCDRQRLSQARTVFLEEHQIQMIEEYLKTQEDYGKPESPE